MFYWDLLKTAKKTVTHRLANRYISALTSVIAGTRLPETLTNTWRKSTAKSTVKIRLPINARTAALFRFMIVVWPVPGLVATTGAASG